MQAYSRDALATTTASPGYRDDRAMRSYKMADSVLNMLGCSAQAVKEFVKPKHDKQNCRRVCFVEFASPTVCCRCVL